MTSVTSAASMASMTSTASFHQKITDPDDLIIPSTQMTNTSPFCGIDHQKSNFLLISDTLPEEAVEASRCHFFENWLIKHKFAILLKPLGTII
jgi:hypothetical protein